MYDANGDRLSGIAHLLLGEEPQLRALDTRSVGVLGVCNLLGLRHHLKRPQVAQVYGQPLREAPAYHLGKRSDGVANVPEGEGRVADQVLLDGGGRQSLRVLWLGVVDALAFVFAYSGDGLSLLIM